jgi:L-seryl-tRNA(Ser) seleniumtransferase
MISAPLQSLFARAAHLKDQLTDVPFAVEIRTTLATIGGGSLPGETLPSVALAITGPGLEERARRLRLGAQPLFTRIENHELLIELRTILPEDDGRLLQTLNDARATELP